MYFCFILTTRMHYTSFKWGKTNIKKKLLEEAFKKRQVQSGDEQ